MLDLEDYGGTEEEIALVLSTRKECQNIINWMLDEKGSLRQCADNLGMSHQKVHRYIHTYISYYWDDAYCQIRRILRWNKRNRFKRRMYWSGVPN